MSNELDFPHDRLKWARERKGYPDKASFARAMGINETSYRAYENGQNGFSKLAARFAKKLGVSVEWLLEGGECPTEEIDDAESDTAHSLSLEILADKLNLTMIPQIDLRYSMGAGTVIEGYSQIGARAFDKDWLRRVSASSFDNLFVASGEGDSMQPTLLHGDDVLIDTAQKDVRQQDRIWAVSYGELGMIKRVRRLPGGRYHLLSDNPVVSPVECVDSELFVVGRVIWIGRRI